jgi:hypothetical protein
LVQAFLKKWWVESDIKAPNLPLSLRFKGLIGQTLFTKHYTEKQRLPTVKNAGAWNGKQFLLHQWHR